MLGRRITKIVNRFTSSQTKNYISIAPDKKQQFLRTLQANSKVAYKKYPYAPHQDPKSPEYIHSQLDEYHDEIQVKAYNQVIDNFKHDLKVQRQVWDAINNLDRPYKKGTPGIDTNISPDGPAKPDLPDLGFPRRDPQNQVKFTFANEDRFIANTPFHANLDFKHIKQWEEQRRNRPVTRHFNAKGYKYDVPVKPQEKFEYVADRLGHPQFVGTPIQWLLRLQNDLYHPVYVDQPFVKTPSPKPHQSLNFEQGQVLYENTRVLQWVKFWQMSGISLGAFGGIFVPYNMAFKTNLVTDAADQMLPLPYHLVSPSTIDIMRLSVPIVGGASFYVVYILLNFVNAIVNEYVSKVTYSKDKELLFVKRVDLHGFLQEEVYQMAHIQILPPSHRSGVATLSAYDEDGLWRVQCLNTQKTFVLYGNPKHWNRELRDQFFKKTLNLWDKSYYGYTRSQQEEKERKWMEEVKQTFTQQALPKN